MRPKPWPGRRIIRYWFFRRWRRKRPKRPLPGAGANNRYWRAVLSCSKQLESILTSTNQPLTENLMKFQFVPRLFLPLSLAAGAFAVAGCGHRTAQQQPPPPSVTVAPVEQKQIVEQEEFTGRAEAVESVEIRPRVSGYIQEVKFQS